MKTKLFIGFMVLTTTINFFANYSQANNKKESCCMNRIKDACCSNEIKHENKGLNNENYSSLIPFGYNNRLLSVKVGLSSADDCHEFILDSGAPTFITDSVAKTHDITLINTETVYDVNHNEQTLDKYCFRKIFLGGRELKNVNANSSNMVDRMPLLKNRPYSGLLGANSMKNNIWIINYDRREITLTNNIDSLPMPNEAFSAKMTTDELNRPTVLVKIGENQTLSFIIDLGYNGSILLPKKYMEKPIFTDSLNFTQNERLSSGFASEISQINYKFIKELSLGEMKLHNIKASSSGNNTEALIGNEFLEKYIVILDFIHEKVTLIPYVRPYSNQYC
jgi:hypothetical protein